MGRIWSRETKRVLELEPVFLREGFQKKNPEKLCPFDKPGGGSKKRKKGKTLFWLSIFFSEHVE